MDSQTSTNAAAREWAVLQPLYERYEFGALTIKLTAVVLFFGGIVVELHAAWLMLLIAVLWLQEGIFKTCQSRLGERLLVIERAIDAGDPAGAFALHSRWQAQRRGVLGLVREYLTSAIRPTVVFPYLVLLVLLWLFYA
ncbi:MAG: hypothetical protein R3E92_15500 [Burkholderiaceae bacterium]|nr:hypothetical protein [Rhodoferax sp.]MCP5261421.1 hypothetical protein [Rhodoferax sp.]